jgi:hypothetical protein
MEKSRLSDCIWIYGNSKLAPAAVVGSGGDTTSVGADICGTNQGCVAVYQHRVRDHDDDREANNDDGERRD